MSRLPHDTVQTTSDCAVKLSGRQFRHILPYVHRTCVLTHHPLIYPRIDLIGLRGVLISVTLFCYASTLPTSVERASTCTRGWRGTQ